MSMMSPELALVAMRLSGENLDLFMRWLDGDPGVPAALAARWEQDPELRRERSEYLKGEVLPPLSADILLAEADPGEAMADFLTRITAAQDLQTRQPLAPGQLRLVRLTDPATATCILILLDEREDAGEEWLGWVVAPIADISLAGQWDLLVDVERGDPPTPVAGMVQTWNRIRCRVTASDPMVGALAQERLNVARSMTHDRSQGIEPRGIAGARGDVRSWRTSDGSRVLTGTPIADHDSLREEYQAIYGGLSDQLPRSAVEPFDTPPEVDVTPSLYEDLVGILREVEDRRHQPGPRIPQNGLAPLDHLVVRAGRLASQATPPILALCSRVVWPQVRDALNVAAPGHLLAGDFSEAIEATADLLAWYRQPDRVAADSGDAAATLVDTRADTEMFMIGLQALWRDEGVSAARILRHGPAGLNAWDENLRELLTFRTELSPRMPGPIQTQMRSAAEAPGEGAALRWLLIEEFLQLAALHYAVLGECTVGRVAPYLYEVYHVSGAPAAVWVAPDSNRMDTITQSAVANYPLLLLADIVRPMDSAGDSAEDKNVDEHRLLVRFRGMLDPRDARDGTSIVKADFAGDHDACIERLVGLLSPSTPF